MPKDPKTPEQILEWSFDRGLYHCVEDICDSAQILIDWAAQPRDAVGRPKKGNLAVLGHIYCFWLPLFGWVKVGRGGNAPQRVRVGTSMFPFDWELLRIIPERPGQTERDLHKAFAEYKIPLNTRRPEWFYAEGPVAEYCGLSDEWGLFRHEEQAEIALLREQLRRRDAA